MPRVDATKGSHARAERTQERRQDERRAEKRHEDSDREAPKSRESGKGSKVDRYA